MKETSKNNRYDFHYKMFYFNVTKYSFNLITINIIQRNTTAEN